VAVETVIPWVSLIIGITSIVLAICAIAYTALNDIRNRRLNIEFTRTLAIIEQKSTNTEASINATIGRIVDEFLNLRREATPTFPFSSPQTTIPTEAEDFLSGPQEEQYPFTAFMAKVERDLEEIRLRQRLQFAQSAASLPERFHVGQRVHVPADTEHAHPSLLGMIGTIRSEAFHLSDPSGIIYRTYMVSFDNDEVTFRPVREEFLYLI